MKLKYILIVVLVLFSGCSSTNESVQKEQNLTVGTVQREITVGMPSSSVIEILGSPNVVTTDEERREVWVYDKISTDVSYSNKEGYASLLVIGSSSNSGSSSKTQRTLTIIIKFDKDNKVRDFAYHTSRF